MKLLEADQRRMGLHRAFSAAKRGQTIGVCIPARNEAATIGTILKKVAQLYDLGVIDEYVVVDDNSSDGTADHAHAGGAVVVPNRHGPGKGQALVAAIAATRADILVFLDADVTNFGSRFVTTLAAPLLHSPEVQMAKATYRRDLNGAAGEGGRVTELLARPLLRRFFPSLASIAQPLAGECAVRRTAVSELRLADGYGVEIGMLIDIYRRYGRASIVEVDLVERVHRNRPLSELRQHADDVLAAAMARVETLDHHRRNTQ